MIRDWIRPRDVPLSTEPEVDELATAIRYTECDEQRSKSPDPRTETREHRR